MACSASRGDRTGVSASGVPGPGVEQVDRHLAGVRAPPARRRSRPAARASRRGRGSRRSTAPCRRPWPAGRWRPGRRRSGWCRSTGTPPGALRGCGCSGARRRRPDARAWAGSSSPREQATSRPVSARTASTALMTLSRSRSLGPRTATTMQNWVAPAARGGPGRLQHLVEVEEGIHLDAGVEVGRLRAEGAVLGAGPRLGVDEALQLHLRPAPGQPHPVGQRDQRRQLVEGEAGDGQGLVAGQGAALVEQGAFGGGERHGDSLDLLPWQVGRVGAYCGGSRRPVGREPPSPGSATAPRRFSRDRRGGRRR